MFAVGERVETEYGAGVVRESSYRRVFIVLDDGQPLNVATGTYGYERITRATPAIVGQCRVCNRPATAASSAELAARCTPAGWPRCTSWIAL